MKKKVLAALLSATMVMSVMTACGGSDEPAASSSEAVVESSSEVVESSSEVAAEPTEAPVEDAAPTMADPEDLPEALYHFAMDGTDEGVVTLARLDSQPGENNGATHGIAESSTYVDKDGVEQPIVVQYANGPVGTCTYVDGNFGLGFPVEGFEGEEYTISFWMNADRLSTYGPSLQLGSNMGMDGTGDPVTWINFTQSEWGANSAKIFPVVWNRNSATGAWPWVYAGDDAIHGKKEWVCVTLVSTGNVYTYAEDGLDRVACQLYLDGVLAFDAVEGSYGGLATGIMAPSNNFECYFGINYWDSIFKGFVDEVYIFDEALTAGQVASLYLEGDASVESVAEAPAELEAEPVANDNSGVATTGTVVGSMACDTAFWSVWSDTVQVAAGESSTVTFKNYTDGLANWDNFLVILQNVADVHSAADNADYKEYAVVRADNFGWGAGYDGIAVAECDWNWDTFAAEMNGADVNLTITNNGDTVDVVAVVTGSSGAVYNQKYTGIAVDGDVYYCLSCEKAFLDIQ